LSQDGLNPEQQAILHHDLDGSPLLVLAGAGTGKTTTITRRLARETMDAGAPDSILALTFTRKAATEMRERVARQLESQGIHGEIPWCGTFHALGLRVLSEIVNGRDGWMRLERAKPELLSEAKSQEARSQFWKERFRQSSGRPWTQLELERLRCEWTTPDALEKIHPNHEGLDIWKDWSRWKRSLGVVDFEDLIGLAIELLETDAELAAHWNARAHTLLVDEYQDTNRSQFRLIKALLGPSRRLLAVGDDDQSIYGFRGANISNILDFQRDFPDAVICKLVRNYRSTGAVLQLSNRIFPDKPVAYRKELKCGRDQNGTPCRWWHALDEDEELAWLSNEVAKFLRQGIPPSDIAVLTRSNRQQDVLRNALREMPSGEQGLQLLTVHAAKGLEWPVVFHPFVDAARDERVRLLPSESDEERRLFYVAVTRARDHLCISSAARRRSKDDWTPHAPLPWHRLVRQDSLQLPGRLSRIAHLLSRGTLRMHARC